MLDNKTIGKMYRSSFGWDVLVDLTEIGNRLAGTEGEYKAAQRVAKAFKEAGLGDVKVNEFPLQGWERGPAELAIKTPLERSYPVIGLPRSPAGVMDAEIVDLGYGCPEDFETDLKGKIALVSSTVPDDYPRRIHRKEKYMRAIDHGAAGFIFQNHIHGQLLVTGSVGISSGLGKIPAVGVTRETGYWLSRFCAEGEVRCTLKVEADTGPATSTVVEGVAGPDSGEEVIISAHHDAHDLAQGAIDDGTGTAIVCEIANALSDKDLETRLRFLTFGGEEVGLEGSKWWSETKGVEGVKAVVNNDFFDGELIMMTHGFDALREVVEEVEDEYGRPIKNTAARHGMWTIADHWHFLRRGVPSIFARADRGRWRGWGHTNADTLDKVKVDELRDHATLIAAIVDKLAESGRFIPRRTSEDVMRELREHGFEPSF